MNAPTSKAQRLIRSVQLEAIRLIDASAGTTIRTSTEVDTVDLKIDFGGRPTGPPTGGVFHVLASLKVELRRHDSPEVVVTVKATYELRYVVPTGFDATEEELKAFAETNGVFNVWPYWREFVQSMVVRMNLPPVILPVFRLADYKKIAAEQAKADKAAKE